MRSRVNICVTVFSKYLKRLSAFPPLVMVNGHLKLIRLNLGSPK